ncbi:RHS repeat protein [Stenotrophomonas sp. MH1]|uniref:RHS repeat protein n=1 Tax=Stenotrophomonas capsici TaxID=3110230 RepID=A0ABU5V3Y9_9GAMM|nr:RHS repeat protein [Stenotrophomonas sp. MH1]MEA5668066.1 RHS repeat protein [Stenotrophomonas sp. MH1]
MEVVTYYDNTSQWVLGQVASRSVDGVVAEQTAHDAITGLPLQHWSFGKLRQTVTYHADGTVATVKDGKNNVTTLSSWKYGIPQSISYADGTSQSATVNNNGWITQVIDQSGYATSYGYDVMGHLASISYPAGDTVAWTPLSQSFVQVQTSEYGIPAGHWRQTVSTGAGTKITYFDALWRPLLVSEYDATSAASTQRFVGYEYDHDGRVVFSSYPSVSSNPDKGVWNTYDALGRQKSSSQDSEHGLLTTTTSYLSDATGAYTLVTVPSGAQTRTWYQMFDQPAYDAPVRIAQPEGSLTTITRDVFGKPISITRGSNDGTVQATRSYRYNTYQELCASVEPETGATLLGYDAAGNLSWSAAGLPAATLCHATGATTTIQPRRVDRTYDSRNHLTSLSFPDGNGNQTWTYTPDGKPSQIITQDVASSTQSINTYTYNKRRLLTAETVGQTGGYSWALGYGYDANGALAGVRYPSGLYVDYAPNALGQPSRAGSYATGVSYHPNGGMSQFVYGNGIVHTMQQNGRQLPARVKDGTALDTSYSYDATGNVTQIADALDSTRTRSMSYDGLDRLAQATSPSFGGGGQVSYSYDALDNLRTTKLAGVKQYNYWYDAANRLSNIVNDAGATVIGFAYDTQGNLANKNGQTFQFDYGNRLRNAVGKETYRYDGHGRRVVSWSPSQGSIISMYGQDGVLRRQDNDRKANSVEYVYLNGSLVAKVSTSTAPAAPVITAPTYSDNGTYTVSWNAVASATSYEVQEQFNGGRGSSATTELHSL